MLVHYKLLNKRLMSAMLIVVTLFLTACSGGGDGGDNTPKTIVISGTVISADINESIEDAQVTIVNVETQQNELNPVYTDVNGKYSLEVPINGIYEVRVAAQGYLPSPTDGVAGIPITETQSFDVILEPISDSIPYGLLSIDLVNYNNSVGALAILTNTTTSESYSAVSSIAGDIMMYNLPVGDYDLTIRTIGHATYTAANITISDNLETAINDIDLTPIDGHTVSGTVTFLAVENAEVDVSLTDKVTGDVIPGTNVYTANTDFSIDSIAPGEYFIRATYKIDGFVVDPDSIVKHGEPAVTVVDADVSLLNIDVTGAVTLTSPIAQSNGIPSEVNTLTPTFSWTAYPSTSDYVVEVLDVNGNVIWGGFADDLTKKVTTEETSIEYSNDGLGQALEYGEIYRWKVYASKDDTKEDTGWKLISSSEDAQGVFRVSEVQ